MGGRKDDVTKPKNRNRPLSAVIEEFEVDDQELKRLVVNNNNDDIADDDEGDERERNDNENRNSNNNNHINHSLSPGKGGSDVSPEELRTCCVHRPNCSSRNTGNLVSLDVALQCRTDRTDRNVNNEYSTSSEMEKVANSSCVFCVRAPSPSSSAQNAGSLSSSPTSNILPEEVVSSSKSSSMMCSTPLMSPANASQSLSSLCSSPLRAVSTFTAAASPPQSGSPLSASPQERSPLLIPVVSVSACDSFVLGESSESSLSLKSLSLSSSASINTSPKMPRRPSLRSRRQALTPGNLSLSPKLVRRGSFGRRALGATDVIQEGDEDVLSPSDMARLRQMTDRLRLSTRRPSTQQWRAQYVECPQFPGRWNEAGEGGQPGQSEPGGGEDEEVEALGRRVLWTEERTQKINTALDWIKSELLEMRAQDQNLARQLLSIRSDIHQLKLARSCEEHQEMLEDVQSELEELQEFADVLDLPTPTFCDSPLKHLGVTRMNLSARRFSTC